MHTWCIYCLCLLAFNLPIGGWLTHMAFLWPIFGFFALLFSGGVQCEDISGVAYGVSRRLWRSIIYVNKRNRFTALIEKWNVRPFVLMHSTFGRIYLFGFFGCGQAISFWRDLCVSFTGHINYSICRSIFSCTISKAVWEAVRGRGTLVLWASWISWIGVVGE